MNGVVFTIRDLEEARRRGRLRKRRQLTGEARDCLIAFLFVAACWLARELLLSL